MPKFTSDEIQLRDATAEAIQKLETDTPGMLREAAGRELRARIAAGHGTWFWRRANGTWYGNGQKKPGLLSVLWHRLWGETPLGVPGVIVKDIPSAAE